MSRLQQDAILVGLARRLNERDSWTGETHIQKATYLLHELLDVDFDFDFILYKHGPFSFELRDELTELRADKLLDRQPQRPPFGPRLFVTERGVELERRFANKMEQFAKKLDWISDKLGKSGVAELERLATAVWVTKHGESGASVQDRATALNKLKSHVSMEDAEAAVRQVDDLMVEARAL